MEDINPDHFRVTSPIKLSKISTKPEKSASEEAMAGQLNETRNSLIREVFKEINPRGVVVHSFKTPNSTELEHDYLWRHYLALPEKGKVAIFNRTHYENVLVTRAPPE